MHEIIYFAMKKSVLFLVILLSKLMGYGQTFNISGKAVFPDNVIQSNCNRPLEGNPWDIQLLHSSAGQDVASYSPILVGDIDGNGVSEIVVAKYNGNNYRSREINVYSGRNLSLQHSFIVPDTIYLSNGPYAIGRYPKADGTMEGAIFTHCYDKKIRAYSINGTLLNVSDRATSCDGMVSLADFNGDGFPEVYAGSDIFDAATLKWLCSGPANGNKGLGYRGTPAYSNGTYHHTYYAMSLAYNALGDEKQELICGNTIYTVNIVSRTNANLNSVTVAKTITPPSGCSQDGHVCLADFDLDGETEVLVIRDDTNDQIVDNTYFYAYKPSNAQILFQKALRCASTSYVFIGNTDTEPYPEIIFLENQPNGYSESIFCWRYTPQSGLATVWSQYHDDRSGQTAMTLFDFNQDNIMELVYRDNNNLRIINASGKSHVTGNDTIRPYNIYTRRMAAGTGCEYPIVADVNGDGVAEIVATGLIDQYVGYDVGYGGVHVFGSPGNWSSARPVWNQYMYHVTNVNEDMTIPTFCFNTATTFTAPDGTVRRPFNNFLQQATYITQYGEPIGEMGEPQYVDIYDQLDGVYTWNGTTYTAPGEYTQQFTDIHGCDSIVTLHLSDEPIELPDNIVESDCNNNIPFPFQGGQLLHHTPNDINVYTTPLCGDIDNDGIVDIVVPHFTATDDNYRAWSNQIDIYSGNDLSLQSIISIPQEIYLLYHPYGIVRYPSENGGMQGAVFVLCNDGKLRSYSKNGQLLHTADVDPPCDGVPAFADFNNDGYPEVYIGNAIYDAATLKQLCAGPANGNKGLSYRGSPPNVYPHHANYALSFAYNFFGDEKMELVCGNTIYNVNIASRTNPALNSITTNKTITPPNGFPQDGQVSLADLDLDGEIDVVVTKDLTDDCVDDNTYFYAYKPSTGNILFQFSIYCRSAGLPVICNIDSDPHPEILFVDYLRDVYSEKMHCLRYTTGNGLDEIWAVHHNDPSGMTTMVFFDFNNDEIPEIVFRDAYALNIINGSDGNVLYSYPMRSGSACEHAIVADVNNDGHAEILATGLLEEYYGNNGHGSLNLFGHLEWPSARQVWNQYAYNVTNINNDLTVPQLGFDNASIFTDPNGSVRRPYNNFMYQATYTTHTGEPYNPNGYYEVEVSGAACSTFTFHGVTYTESGNYEQLIESPDGCDTLYHIAVSIGGTITHEWSQQACNHYVWNGTNYTEPGDYIQDFVSVEGCDSIVTLHLAFSDALEYDVDTAVCQSLWWNGQEYTEAGVYTQQFLDVDGCDSIVHLHLSFAGQPEGIPEIIGLTEVNVGTDLIVGQYYYHIDSVPLATHYEWTLEGADWIMDTTGTHCSLLITTPGTAVLKVRVWNDCGETEQEIVIHAGFFDVDERQAIQVVLYPNPANDKVLVEAEDIKSVKVYNLQGQLLKTWDGEASNRVEISLHNIGAGMYAVEVLTERGSIVSKMTVTHKE